jgi:hypothetical protein
MVDIRATDHEERVRDEVKAAVAAYRAMLDTFVGSRTTPEVGHAHPRRPHGAETPPASAR